MFGLCSTWSLMTRHAEHFSTIGRSGQFSMAAPGSASLRADYARGRPLPRAFRRSRTRRMSDSDIPASRSASIIAARSFARPSSRPLFRASARPSARASASPSNLPSARPLSRASFIFPNAMTIVQTTPSITSASKNSAAPRNRSLRTGYPWGRPLSRAFRRSWTRRMSDSGMPASRNASIIAARSSDLPSSRPSSLPLFLASLIFPNAITIVQTAPSITSASRNRAPPTSANPPRRAEGVAVVSDAYIIPAMPMMT